MEFEDFIYMTYGILDYIFQILDTGDVPVKHIKPCLAIVLQKSENDIAKIIKKTHNFGRKTKNYLKEHEMTLINYIQIFQRKRKKKDSWECGRVLPKSRYHSIYFRRLFQFQK